MSLSDGQEKIVLNGLSSIRKVEDTYILQLEKTMRQLERNLTDFINDAKVAGIVDTALSRQQIQQILIDSGYYRTTGALLNDGYQAVIDDSAALYNNLYGENFQFQEVSLQQLNALKNLDLSQFNQLAGDAAQSVNRVLTGLQFGDIKFNDALVLLRENVIDKLQQHAKTWMTTGLSGIYRKSTMDLATDNGIEKFQYVGPLDSVTRAFCKKYVGQVMTRAEWDKIDNGQVSPVSTYGGGYNCRHSFVGVLDK